VMRKPAILRSLTYDLYLAPLGLETGSQNIDLVQDEPVRFQDARMTFLGFEIDSMHDQGGNMRILAKVAIESGGSEPEEIDLVMISSSTGMHSEPVEAQSFPGTPLLFDAMSVEQRMIRIVAGSGSASQVLVITATIKPLMNVLWTGTILLLLGCTVAVIRRYADKLARLQEA